MTSESDETIQIYKVKEGLHDKSLLSKKYGVKLAKFTHMSSGIIYASTKQNGSFRLCLGVFDLVVMLTAAALQTQSDISPHTTTPSSATLMAMKAGFPVLPCTPVMITSYPVVKTTQCVYGTCRQSSGSDNSS